MSTLSQKKFFQSVSSFRFRILHRLFSAFAGAYSYLGQIAIIFLITDLLRYKPLIVLNGACGVIIWSILLWANSVISVQVVEGFWGTFCATEVAYFSYIYAKTDKKHFQAVTSHTRAAIFFGKFFSSLSAQVLVFFKVMNYRQLNYLTLIGKLMNISYLIDF